METVDLNRLERDVEFARARVHNDLKRLQAPQTLASFKEDALSSVRGARDDFVTQAKDAATEAAQRVFIEIKDRAAANPVAALAIGAGLAWRLLHKPPIASILVGFGLVSLIKTNPQQPSAGADLVVRAGELAVVARDKIGELTADAGEFAVAAKHNAGELAVQAGDAIVSATESATETAAAVQAKVQEWSSGAADAVAEIAGSAKNITDRGVERLGHLVQDPEERDKVLLGAATVALIAAVGMAAQRRLGDHAPPDAPR
jgi:hypothetical protein